MNEEEKRDSARKIREMEQIEQGLEQFLEQELKNMEKDRQFYDYNLKDTPDEEYAGRVNTVNREIPEADAPRLAEEIDEEQDLMGTGASKGRKRQKELQDDYLEDWDKPRSRKQTGTAGNRSGTGRTAGSRSSAGAERAAGGRSSAGTGKPTGSRSSAGTGKSAGNRTSSASGGRNNSMPKNSKTAKAASRKKKKKSRLKKFLITAAVIIALLGAAQYYLVGLVYSKMNYREIESEDVLKAPIKEEGVINILLIGNDSRQNGEDGRSDAMILLSISDKTKKIYMTSLLRDMYVDIPGRDGNRLNAAYSFGGAELLMETVEKNLDISVNRYVMVNFEAFANLVDAVGGVDLELTSKEVEYVNAYLWEYNVLTERPEGTDYMDTSLSGLIHLNGPQALAYSRNRYIGTDFGRTERQRKVLSAVFKKLPGAMVSNPKELLDGLMPNLTTNLTKGECYRLSFMAGKLLSYEIVQSSIPQEGTYKNADIRGMAVLEVDFEANKRYIRENIYGSKED